MLHVEKRATGARRLIVVGLLAIVTALVANLVIRALAFALLPLSPDIFQLQLVPICFFTVLLVGAAVLVYAAVLRFAKRPARVYTLIALIVLVLSFIPDIMKFGATNPLAMSVLLAFHVVDAAIVLVAMLRFVPSRW